MCTKNLPWSKGRRCGVAAAGRRVVRPAAGKWVCGRRCPRQARPRRPVASHCAAQHRPCHTTRETHSHPRDVTPPSNRYARGAACAFRHPPHAEKEREMTYRGDGQASCGVIEIYRRSKSHSSALEWDIYRQFILFSSRVEADTLTKCFCLVLAFIGIIKIQYRKLVK